MWQRTLVFPPTAIDAAADAYLELHAIAPPNASFFLGFMRAPPNAPRPGAPVTLLAASFFGPAAAAEKAFAVTFSDVVLSKSVNATTISTPFSDIHNALDSLNAPGGYKELYGLFFKDLSASSLSRSFAAFLAYTNDKPALFGSSVIIPVSNTKKSESLATETNFYNLRDRGIYVQVKTSYPAAGHEEEADAFAKSIQDSTREEDRKAGRRDWAFANNMVEGMDLEDVYTAQQISEIARVGGIWNKAGVGWVPTADEWRSYTQSRDRGAKAGTLL